MKTHLDYPGALSYLLSLQKFGIKLGLSNIGLLLQALGSPHLRFPSVLIGGTNGKGSTAAFLDSILRQAGYRVGLYTSPHLLDFRERIRVNGEIIPEEEVVKGVNSIRDHIATLLAPRPSSAPRLPFHPTFFEITTALAFHHFAREKVDLAVVEVGMGGRYDATNVLPSQVSVITNVDWDHQEYLGKDLSQIAAEKAGIIKEGGWLISGVDHPEAREIVDRMAAEKGARTLYLGRHIHYRFHSSSWNGQEISLQGFRATYPQLKIGLLGGHQASNAALAVGAAEVLTELGIPVGKDHIYAGLAQARWPARMQIVGNRPLLLVDSAHNPGGARALAETVRQLGAPGRLFLVFGVLEDKDWRSMLEILAPLAEGIILCRPPSERAADPYHLKGELAGRFSRIEVQPEVAEAIFRARSQATSGDTILIAGSLFTAAAALKALGLKVP